MNFLKLLDEKDRLYLKELFILSLIVRNLFLVGSKLT